MSLFTGNTMFQGKIADVGSLICYSSLEDMESMPTITNIHLPDHGKQKMNILSSVVYIELEREWSPARFFGVSHSSVIHTVKAHPQRASLSEKSSFCLSCLLWKFCQVCVLTRLHLRYHCIPFG